MFDKKKEGGGAGAMAPDEMWKAIAHEMLECLEKKDADGLADCLRTCYAVGQHADSLQDSSEDQA